MLELQVPFLGGALWTSEEARREADEADWLELACERLIRKRDSAAELRSALRDCVSDVGRAKLELDVTRSEADFAKRISRHQGGNSLFEPELARNPHLKVLYMAARAAGQNHGRLFGKSAYYKYFYRELREGWKATR